MLSIAMQSLIDLVKQTLDGLIIHDLVKIVIVHLPDRGTITIPDFLMAAGGTFRVTPERVLGNWIEPTRCCITQVGDPFGIQWSVKFSRKVCQFEPFFVTLPECCNEEREITIIYNEKFV